MIVKMMVRMITRSITHKREKIETDHKAFVPGTTQPFKAKKTLLDAGP
jgi:hypothetical protein